MITILTEYGIIAVNENEVTSISYNRNTKTVYVTFRDAPRLDITGVIGMTAAGAVRKDPKVMPGDWIQYGGVASAVERIYIDYFTGEYFYSMTRFNQETLVAEEDVERWNGKIRQKK